MAAAVGTKFKDLKGSAWDEPQSLVSNKNMQVPTVLVELTVMNSFSWLQICRIRAFRIAFDCTIQDLMKLCALSIHDHMYDPPRFIDRRWNMVGKRR